MALANTANDFGANIVGVDDSHLKISSIAIV
jgi:hypothetical protein